MSKKKEKMCEACGSVITEEKWMQKAVHKKGALHKELGIPEDKPIPKALINKKIATLRKRGEGDKKLSAADRKLLQRLIFAKNAKALHEAKVSLNAEIGVLLEKSPPGKEKEVEEIKKGLMKRGYSEERAAHIAFGKAWNDYKKKHEEEEEEEG